MRYLIFCAASITLAGAAHVSAQQAFQTYPPQPPVPYGYPQPQYIYVPVPQPRPQPEVIKPAPMPQPAPAPVPEIKVDARPSWGQIIVGGAMQGAAQSGMNRILGGI